MFVLEGYHVYIVRCPFTAWLNERCAFLHNLESEANQALHQENDTPRYRELMQQKANVSCRHSRGNTSPVVPAGRQSPHGSQAPGQVYSAENALSIGSTFYMSALLYPEDYQEGQMNDLHCAPKKHGAGKRPQQLKRHVHVAAVTGAYF